MLALALLILAVLLFGGGFLYNALWIAAVVFLVIAAVSFLTGRNASTV